MSKIDRIMTIGLVIFWLVVLVLILFCVLIREYLYFKNYISELEKRNQKLGQRLRPGKNACGTCGPRTTTVSIILTRCLPP